MKIPREAIGCIVCVNCHLANKPVDIEDPQAIFPVIVFEAVVRISYDLKQVLVNDSCSLPSNFSTKVLPEEVGAAVAVESSTALSALRLEVLRIPTVYIKTFQSQPHGI
ncbi:hypothetical protein GOBAR_DD19923 [Gossypium barbadense]|nr:hypothetical protein GOBAR_DD19923 [Gossypium barbadense]